MKEIDPRNIEVMDDAMAEVYRNKTVAERLRIANQIFEFVRRMIRAQIQTAHPDWTDEQLIRETAYRISNGFVKPEHFAAL
jgi:ABC-type transport system involved in cytochrome bd biosynthesis fused ATPase/permease subunit